MWFDCVVNCSAVLVISLTVIEYFSKRVVNDVIKSEVSTGVRYFIGRAAAKPGQKSDIESFSNVIHKQLTSNILVYCCR